MQLFPPVDLGPCPNIRAHLRRIGERLAYRRVTAMGDPDMKPTLD